MTAVQTPSAPPARPAAPSVPTFSIVIETANLGTAELEGLERALDSLAAQDLSVASAREVLLVEGGEAPPETIRGLRVRYPWLRVVSGPASGEYYDTKSFGVARTSGDVVVFADSDCVYEPTWLRSLLAPFAPGAAGSASVDVVGGATSTGGSGPYGAAMRIAYLFPAPTREASLTPASRYFLNNVAFRREALRQVPMPRGLPIYRGNCALHALQLRRAGFGIWRQTAARCVHAAPNGLSHFVTRFFLRGHDWAATHGFTRLPRTPRDAREGTASAAGEDVRRVSSRLLPVLGRTPRDWANFILGLPILAAAFGLIAAGMAAALLLPRRMARFAMRASRRDEGTPARDAALHVRLVDRRAGPAPRVSVVIPVRNGARYLGRCLAALRASRAAAFEVIVVDDASTDATPEILAREAPDLVVRFAARRGAFAARNVGASFARGEILFFTDADVAVRPDTLARVVRHLDASAREAVIGLYAIEHPNRNLCSQYKNAWIRHSYLETRGHPGWFFTAVGAVRTELFRSVGGFAPAFDPRTGGGDVEFGRHLVAAGAEIVLDRDLEVVHLKSFDLSGLLGNDGRRAYGWTRLALARERKVGALARGGYANVSGGFVASVALVGVLLAALALCWLHVSAAAVAGAALVLHLVANRRFLGYVRRELGALRGAQSWLLLLVDHAACGFGIAAALAERAVGRGLRPRAAPAAVGAGRAPDLAITAP